MACEQVTLQDVCELIVDCPHTSAKDEGVGYPLIRTPNVGRGRLILTDVHRVSQDVYERRVSRAVPRQGDLILAREAPAGNVAIVSPGIEVCLGQRTMLLRPDSSFVVPEYLNYYLNAPEQRDRMLRLANGATVSHINVADIRNMPVQLPSCGEQSKVAELLNVLDDKIDLNNRLNDYLLEVGEMRFADLETRGTLSKTVHIADLPHILETGKRPKGGAASCGIPSVGAENVKKLGEFNYSSNKYIPRTFADNLKKGRVNGYELMIYKDGGRPGQFIPHFSMFGEGYPYKEFYINEHVFKLDFGDRGLNEFAYYYFHTPYVMKWLETNGTKVAIPGINRQNIEELEFPDPEQESVQDFCKRIQPYFTAIFRNCLENKQLQSLRDTLLPRLMSGEIDVSKVDLTQLTNNHLWVHGHNVPNRYWKGRLWKPSLIMFCHRCRTCSIRHSSNIWPKYSESRYCQLRKHPCRRIC